MRTFLVHVSGSTKTLESVSFADYLPIEDNLKAVWKAHRYKEDNAS
jgi:hypothetical protein